MRDDEKVDVVIKGLRWRHKGQGRDTFIETPNIQPKHYFLCGVEVERAETII